jgi:predicted phage terminase large subunit-like protein
MSETDRAVLTATLRSDLASFIRRSFQTVSPGSDYAHNWHIEVLAHRLEQCLAGEISRLIITLPPRHLKSICASVAFPAWALGRDPTRRIICASYSSDLAAKHARDCRAIIESRWYREVFPATRLDGDKNTELEFATTKRGVRLTTSVGGTLTGRGGNLVIIDDPLKASDALSEPRRDFVNEWFRNTLYSRLDDKARDAIVVVMQRLHVDDLVGHLIAAGEGWTELTLPAIAEAHERFDLGDGRVFGRRPGEALHPAREPLETLAGIKKTIGTHDFSAQYLQNPLPLDGGVIKWSWFRHYAAPPERQDGDFVTQSWDTASKAEEINDFSVCTTWLRRGSDHYLIDVRRERLEYPALKRLIVVMAERHRPDAVLVEDKGSGIQLIQDLRHEGRVRPIPITPKLDKVTRMNTQTAKIEAGHVLLPETAPWLEDFKAEVLQFPCGRHDDQVDSLSQYLARETSTGMHNAPYVLVPSRIKEEMEAEFGIQEY